MPRRGHYTVSKTVFFAQHDIPHAAGHNHWPQVINSRRRDK